MIGSARGIPIVFGGEQARCVGSDHILREGSLMPRSQAFHAWLPSFRPYGTEICLILNSYRLPPVTPRRRASAKSALALSPCPSFW